MFTQRFIITGSTENDTVLAMLAIFYTINDKLEDNVPYIVEDRTPPVMFGMGGMFTPDVSATAPEDDELNDQLKSEDNACCVHTNNIFGLSSILSELEKKQSAVFVIAINQPRTLATAYECDIDEANAETLSQTGAEYGYIQANVRRDTSDELIIMMKKKLESFGLYISGVEEELKLYCQKATLLDEYHLNSLMHGLLNTWLLSGRKERALLSEDITPLLKTMGPSNRLSAHGVNGQPATKLVGLKAEREKIDGVTKMLSFEQKRRQIGITNGFNGCNMVFAGPPGTAKTTLAREFAQKLAEAKLITSAENFKECRKSDLVGKYVGWTAAMVDRMFEDMSRAGGGVIFFDEIYTLTEKEQTCFDTEAVTCIVQNMENYRGTVFCIFAGYEDKMDTFLSSNPGIRSRIHFTVKFGHYDTGTLVDITKSVCESCGYDFPKGGESVVSDYFEHLRRIRGSQFGNGREARNLVSNASQKMAVRLWDVKKPTVKKLRSLSISDLQLAAEDILSSEVHIADSGERRMGF